MDSEKRAGVAECEFDGGVDGDHVGAYSGGVRTRLDLELFKLDTLQRSKLEKINKLVSAELL